MGIDVVFSTGQGGSNLVIILTMLAYFFLRFILPIVKFLALVLLVAILVRKVLRKHHAKGKGIDEEL